VPTLGADQQKLDLVVQVAEVSIAVVKIVAMLDMLQPMALTDPYRPKDFFREIARRGELIEPVYRGERRLSPGLALLRFVGLVLAAAGYNFSLLLRWLRLLCQILRLPSSSRSHSRLKSGFFTGDLVLGNTIKGLYSVAIPGFPWPQ